MIKKPSNKNMKEFGVTGLGRMGRDLAQQAIEKSWRVVGYNCGPEQTRALSRKGLVATASWTRELKPEPGE
jgi:6-phosphogluconate dehydrogenase (decarboxylating)